MIRTSTKILLLSNTAAIHTPQLPLLVPRRQRAARTKSTFLLRAADKDDLEIDPRNFDEGAAQVRRLMNRDKNKFSGKEFETLLEGEFSTSQQPSTNSSPFGRSQATPLNPFETTETEEPLEDNIDEQEDRSLLGFLQNITMTQIVLAISFSLITAIMLGTFTFVFKSGAIHFND